MAFYKLKLCIREAKTLKVIPFYFSFLFSPAIIYGQSVFNVNGAELYSNQNALIHVNGSVNYAGGPLLHNGTLELTGNWFNNSVAGNEVFNSASAGVVKLTGGLQELGGYTTDFPSLSLDGTATKTLYSDTKVSHNLYLDGVELDVNGNDIEVLSSASDAVQRSIGGYVNTNSGLKGRLLRNVSVGNVYEYPVGGGVPLRYRPLTVTAKESGVVAAQFLDHDPADDGYNRIYIADGSENKINDRFYHVVEGLSDLNMGSVKLAYNSNEDGGVYNGLASWGWSNNVWSNAGKVETGAESGEGTDQSISYSFNRGGKFVLGLMDTVTSSDPIFVVSGFTPNGDGKNDHFVVKGLESYKSNELIVFNRWGKVVYRSSNYQNDWDGKGAEELDTYMYELKVTDSRGRSRVVKGDVTILR